MSIDTVLDSPAAVDFSENCSADPMLIDQLSQPLVGQWNVLVSQTNWEKGSLILRWRNELITAGQPNTVYSDESWARRVGNVSAQHVGRLRRTAERFGGTYQNFSGLFWSHFFAALDWDDAELWLEGAVQNDWSVAQMQVQRWDTLGVSDKHKPQDSDIISVEIDEESYSSQPKTYPQTQIEARTTEIGAPEAVEGFDASALAGETTSETIKQKESSKKNRTKQTETDGMNLSAGEVLMKLKKISDFPADLSEPLELLKIAILNHQLAGWQAVSSEEICRTLDALKLLTVAK